MSESKEVKVETPFGKLLETSLIPIAPAEPPPLMEVEDDGSTDAQELELSVALDQVYDALRKIGVSEKSLTLALGIEPPSERKARMEKRKADREERKAKRSKKSIEKVSAKAIK